MYSSTSSCVLRSTSLEARASFPPLNNSTPGKANFPFQANAHTHMGENGSVVYKRAAGDEFIVPYNPWLTLEFDAHVNAEYAATKNCKAHLYKYMFKGS